MNKSKLRAIFFYLFFLSSFFMSIISVDDPNFGDLNEQDCIEPEKESVKNVKKNNSKTSVEKSTESAVVAQRPIVEKLFVNGRINPIILVITDLKNNVSQLTIPCGQRRNIFHEEKQLKQVVCHEKYSSPLTLTTSHLNTYAAFVFNTDGKLERYHFINVKDKNRALDQARWNQDVQAFNKVDEQTIYLL